MLWVFVALAALSTVVIGLVAVGRETLGGATRARPAVFDLEEAVQFIADGLPDAVAGRLTYDDVRWVLRTDADLLEEATSDAEQERLGIEVLDEEVSLVRLLERADAQERGISDADLAVVLAGRTRYLEAIGAVGPRAHDPSRGSPDTLGPTTI